MKPLRSLLLALLALCLPAHALAQYGGTFGQPQPGYQPGTVLSSAMITTNIALDLDSRFGVTGTSSVTSWADADANSTGLGEAAVSGSAPALVASDALFGGQPSINFGVSGNYLRIASFSQAATFTSYIVGQEVTNTTSLQISNSAAVNFEPGPFHAGGTAWAFSCGLTITGGTWDANVHAFGILCNGTSSTMIIDSSATAALSGNAGTSAMSGYFQVGQGASIMGKVARILIYNTAHTQAQQAQMFRYLGALYGQTWSVNDNGEGGGGVNRLAWLDVAPSNDNQALPTRRYEAA